MLQRATIWTVVMLMGIGLVCAADIDQNSSKIDAWQTQLRGANYVAYSGHAAEDFPVAKRYGIKVLRLFLPGVDKVWPEDEDYFVSTIYQERLQQLDSVIQLAAESNLKVIVVGGTVPGRMYQWYQHGRGDRRLWRTHWRHGEFAKFWQRIAGRYRDNATVIAYELLNEPHFENSREPDEWSHDFLVRFAKEVADTPGDLNLLYQRTVKAIREVDPDTPIILDSGAWASPNGFFYLKPLMGDDKIIYSFHWYSPQEYTIWRQNKGELVYPGCVTQVDTVKNPKKLVEWNIDAHRQYMAEPIVAWQKRANIPSNRIFVGEFSADRRVPGADAWNRDVISVLEENGWHWTYYIFRERNWNAKDFELGVAANNTTRSETPLMKTFADAMRN